MNICPLAICALVVAAAAGPGCGGGTFSAPDSFGSPARIPVILDTDIGDDIDDTWALVMLLKSPQFDVKLITTTNGKSEYRARILAKLLTVAGRTDIPIGLGAGELSGSGKQQRWIDGFPLDAYAGKVHRDGVATLIDAVHRSPRPVTIIAIGPLQTLAAALARDPAIAAKANLVGMQGSVFRGYQGSGTPQVEYNVKTDVAAAKKVLSAPWRSITIAPLDTCGVADMTIAGERFAALRKSNDRLARALLENYAIWSGVPDSGKLNRSTALYDTVAIYLADPARRDLINLQDLRIAVSDDGATVVSPRGKMMAVATSWRDLEAYRDHLLKILQ
jgi:inosine-uridine nucleoside N-ribohydrolase